MTFVQIHLPNGITIVLETEVASPCDINNAGMRNAI